MIKPARGYILVEPIKDNEKTAGGVYRPEASKDKPMKGKVIGVGAQKYSRVTDINGEFVELVQSEVKPDDVIYYKKWGNDEVQEEGKDYVFLRFEDILGIYESGK